MTLNWRWPVSWAFRQQPLMVTTVNKPCTTVTGICLWWKKGQLHRLQNEHLRKCGTACSTSWFASLLLQKRFPVISTTTYKTAQQIFRRGFDAHKIEDFHKMQINTFVRNRFIHFKSQITYLWNSNPSYQSQEKKDKMLSWMHSSYALSHNTQGSSLERKDIDVEVLLLNVVKKGQCGWWGLIQLSSATEN